MLIVTGPPGSGKSTVAPLCAPSDSPSVCIETDWFWTTIRGGYVEPWRPEADQQNPTVLGAASSSALAFEQGGYTTIVEGIVGPWMLGVLADVVGEAAPSVDYVVLRPSLEACLERARGRADEPSRVPGHPPLTDSGPILHMWEQFADLGPFEQHVIDSTALDPVATVERIQTARRDATLRLDLDHLRPR